MPGSAYGLPEPMAGAAPEGGRSGRHGFEQGRKVECDNTDAVLVHAVRWLGTKLMWKSFFV